jgi:ABC-type multidrug transport system fused ATPase/permease subunit
MEDGEIAESGTHADLVSRNGKYKKLYEMQFEAVK